MHKHAKTCWGTEIVSKALETKNELTVNEVCKSLSKVNLQDGTITTLFERKGKGNVSFSIKQTYTETWSVNILISQESYVPSYAELSVLNGWQRA